MATPRQVEANRRNASSSTGPRTDAGKDRSRRNGLKHGLAGKGIVLLEDDQGLIDDRLADWAADLKPGNSVEQYLVLQAVTASVQLDRATLQESADRVDRLRSARDAWDEARAAEVRDLLRALPGQGRQIAPRLRRSALGCQQMIDHWERLNEALERDEETRSHIFPSWSPAQFQLALDLLGVDVQDPAGKAVQYFHRVLGDYQRLETLAKPASTVTQEEVLLRQEEIRQKPEVYEALRELIADQITYLEADRDRIAEEIDGPSRNEAPQRVLVDLSQRGDLLRRYQSTHSTALHRSLTQYHKLVKARRDDPGPFVWDNEPRDEPNSPARDEPNEARDEPNEPAPPNSQPPSPSPHPEEARDEPNKPTSWSSTVAMCLTFLLMLAGFAGRSAESTERAREASVRVSSAFLPADLGFLEPDQRLSAVTPGQLSVRKGMTGSPSLL
ncbi:hypothetical protein BH23PLA1_BH23PLA1_32070 [soil metagenome]